MDRTGWSTLAQLLPGTARQADMRAGEWGRGQCSGQLGSSLEIGLVAVTRGFAACLLQAA